MLTPGGQCPNWTQVQDASLMSRFWELLVGVRKNPTCLLFEVLRAKYLRCDFLDLSPCLFSPGSCFVLPPHGWLSFHPVNDWTQSQTFLTCEIHQPCFVPTGIWQDNSWPWQQLTSIRRKDLLVMTTWPNPPLTLTWRMQKFNMSQIFPLNISYNLWLKHHVRLQDIPVSIYIHRHTHMYF